MDASAHVYTNTAVGSPTRIAPALAPVSLAFAVSVCAMSIRGSRQGSCGGSRHTLHVAPRPASSTLPLQLAATAAAPPSRHATALPPVDGGTGRIRAASARQIRESPALFARGCRAFPRGSPHLTSAVVTSSLAKGTTLPRRPTPRRSCTTLRASCPGCSPSPASRSTPPTSTTTRTRYAPTSSPS